MTDHYKTLGVSRTATLVEIKAAYRKLAMLHHPDRNRGSGASAEKFLEVAAAYEVLADPVKRAAYDGDAPRGEQRREHDAHRKSERADAKRERHRERERKHEQQRTGTAQPRDAAPASDEPSTFFFQLFRYP